MKTIFLSIILLLIVKSGTGYAEDAWKAVEPKKVRAYWVLPTGDRVDLKHSWVQVEICPNEVENPGTSPCTEILERIPMEQLTLSGEWKLQWTKAQIQLLYKHNEGLLESFAVAQTGVSDGWFSKAPLCASGPSRYKCRAIVEFNKSESRARLRVVFSN